MNMLTSEVSHPHPVHHRFALLWVSQYFCLKDCRSTAAAASAVATLIGVKVFETRARFAAGSIVSFGINSRFAIRWDSMFAVMSLKTEVHVIENTGVT